MKIHDNCDTCNWTLRTIARKEKEIQTLKANLGEHTRKLTKEKMLR